jgi:hypothetical protein
MSDIDPSTITPDGLLKALKQAGFTEHGRTAGMYARLNWPANSASPGMLLVPLDPKEESYPTMVSKVLETLARTATAGAAATTAIATITAAARLARRTTTRRG